MIKLIHIVVSSLCKGMKKKISFLESVVVTVLCLLPKSGCNSMKSQNGIDTAAHLSEIVLSDSRQGNENGTARVYWIQTDPTWPISAIIPTLIWHRVESTFLTDDLLA